MIERILSKCDIFLPWNFTAVELFGFLRRLGNRFIRTSHRIVETPLNCFFVLIHRINQIETHSSSFSCLCLPSSSFSYVQTGFPFFLRRGENVSFCRIVCSSNIGVHSFFRCTGIFCLSFFLCPFILLPEIVL